MVKTELRQNFLGSTLYLASEYIEMEVTLDVGPRIIWLSKKGGQNIFFHDKEDAINKDVHHIYGEGKRWHIYGGHRVWISPEEDKTYYPDNDKVSYEVFENGAKFISPLWEVWKVQPILHIAFLDQRTVEVKMELINKSEIAKELSVWGLTVMKSGGVMSMDLDTSDTGYLPNRNLVLWHYSDIKDKRLELANNKLILKSNNRDTKPFKIGAYNKNLRVNYEFGDTEFIKIVKAEKGRYPDYFCNMEAYTNHLIHEIESLSPLKMVEVGGSILHTEIWQIN